MCASRGVVKAGKTHHAPFAARTADSASSNRSARGFSPILNSRGALVAGLAVRPGVHRSAASEHEASGSVPQIERRLDLGGVVVAPRRGALKTTKGKVSSGEASAFTRGVTPMDTSLSWESVVFVWPLTIAAGNICG